MNEITDYNHVILYAKGWYKQTDVLSDLRRIMSVRANIEERYVTDSDIWKQMTGLLMKHSKSHTVEMFLDKLFEPLHGEIPDDRFAMFSDTCPLRRALTRILTVLQGLSCVKDGVEVLNLGEPDPTILPPEKADWRKRWDDIMKSRKD